MKRVLVAIFAIIYFTISSGVVMGAHYCMGRLSSVKWQAFAAASCMCGKKESKGCCKTELKVVKIQDDQKVSDATLVFQLPVATVNELSLFQASLYNAPAEVQQTGHSPPLLSTQDTYLRNCVFRI